MTQQSLKVRKKQYIDSAFYMINTNLQRIKLNVTINPDDKSVTKDTQKQSVSFVWYKVKEQSFKENLALLFAYFDDTKPLRNPSDKYNKKTYRTTLFSLCIHDKKILSLINSVYVLLAAWIQLNKFQFKYSSIGYWRMPSTGTFEERRGQDSVSEKGTIRRGGERDHDSVGPSQIITSCFSFW
jgi:hypothetical protein